VAALPLITQLFNSFLGQQENIHSILLPDLFSAGGSKNLWLDKYGRAKRILGYDNQNPSAFTTDTGASAAMIRALFPYRKTSGGSTTRQTLIALDDQVNEFELWHSTDDGVTATFIADLGSTVVGQIPSFGQQGDTCIICTGKVAPRSWNGTSLTTAGATQSPTVTSAAGSSGVLDGVYKWKLLSLKSGVRQAGSAPSTALSLHLQRGSLSWTADADVAVTDYELYRTSGTGEVYYFVTIIQGRATASYTDNTSDADILENRILEEHGDAPPTAYFAVPHKQRMWYLRTDTNPQKGYWSDPGLPASVLDTNNLNFADAETQGDVITGGIGDYEGKLVVFEEKSIWTVDGDGTVIGNIDAWRRNRTNAQTGTVHVRTAVRVPAGSKYVDQEGKFQTTNVVTLAYLTPLLDIRLFDGDNDLVISHPKKDQLSTLNYAQRAKSYAVQDIFRSEIAWVYPDGTSTEPSRAVVWNYRWGVWYEREWGFGHIVAQDNSTESSFLLAGERSTATGAFIYKLWTGHSFNGANFKAQWMTKTFNGLTPEGVPDLSHDKRWRWADLLFQTEQNVTLTLELVAGNAPDNASAIVSKTFSPTTSGILSASGSTLVSADPSNVVVGADSTNARLKLKTGGHYHHGEGMRLRVFDDAQLGSWALEAMNLAYQRLPGLKRS
jgi:hypothetical protein